MTPKTNLCSRNSLIVETKRIREKANTKLGEIEEQRMQAESGPLC